MKAILDLLFPPRCIGCKKRDVWLCPDCVSRFPRVEPPICHICGHPTAGTHLCSFCYTSPPRIEGIRAPFYFIGVLRESIHRFKYKHARHLAEPLAGVLAEYLSLEPNEFDVIVPVPLHEARFRERGYNQSELLAIELGRILNKVVVNDKLKRLRPTKAQMSLPAQERPGNVRGAFVSVDSELSGSNILIVDDVCTTGSTLEACSMALKRSGAKTTWGLCLARVRRHHELITHKDS